MRTAVDRKVTKAPSGLRGGPLTVTGGNGRTSAQDG
jgi:hypothetical protein